MEQLLVLAVFGLCIVIHEFGHFLAAKAVGIPIEKFGIGFGPAILKWNMMGAEFRLSPLLLGGYVKPAIDQDEIRQGFSKAKRLLFYLSGPLANAVSPIIFFMVATFVVRGFDPVILTIPAKMLGFVWNMLSEIAGSDKSLELVGPVGIVSEGAKEMADFVSAGVFFFMINVNLAIFNLLPLPVLDGGRIATMLVEDFAFWKKAEMPVLASSLALMFGLMAYVTYEDVLKLLS